MNAVNLVDDVPEEVAADHAVCTPLKNSGNNIAAVASICTLKTSQIRKESWAFCPIGTHCLFIVNKSSQLVTSDAIFFCSPIPPSVRWFNSFPELLSCHSGLMF